MKYAFRPTNDITLDEVVEIFRHWRKEGVDKSTKPILINSFQYSTLLDTLKRQYIRHVNSKHNKRRRKN